MRLGFDAYARAVGRVLLDLEEGAGGKCRFWGQWGGGEWVKGGEGCLCTGGKSSCVRFVGFMQDGWMGWGEGGDVPVE